MTNNDSADTAGVTPAMTACPAPGPSSPRFANIDLLRGLVMVVMLLDHTRDFVHITGLTADPTDLRTTTPALFFTRWITHYCAPVFVFLAGLSARLQVVRGIAVRDVAGGLVRRGLFFVALELLVLRPLIWFNLDWSFVAHLQVIWAIGWSLCGLGLLLRLPASFLGIGGLAFLLLHNHASLLTHVPFALARADSWESVRMLLFGRGGIQFGGSDDAPIVIVQYALAPWFAVLLVGQWCGTLWALPVERRRRWLLGLGLAATGAFLLLRGMRWHGDPSAWSATETGWRSVASFLRVEKYPPSLHYCLMTLGPALLLLVASERVRADGPWRHLVTLGRVPLFFYVLQWPAVHLVARLFQWIDGQPIGWESANPVTLEAIPPGCGFSLAVVYLVWGVCLVVLVPLSLWFAGYRARRPQTRWLRYL